MKYRITSGSMDAAIESADMMSASVEAVKQHHGTLGLIMEIAEEGDPELYYVSTEVVCRKAGLWKADAERAGA